MANTAIRNRQIAAAIRRTDDIEYYGDKIAFAETDREKAMWISKRSKAVNEVRSLDAKLNVGEAI